MVYSEAIKAGLILPKKKKYTMKDVHNVRINSLFGPGNRHTLDMNVAIAIVKLSAVFHDADFSKSVDTWDETKRFIKRVI